MKTLVLNHAQGPFLKEHVPDEELAATTARLEAEGFTVSEVRDEL